MAKERDRRQHHCTACRTRRRQTFGNLLFVAALSPEFNLINNKRSTLMGLLLLLAERQGLASPHLRSSAKPTAILPSRSRLLSNPFPRVQIKLPSSLIKSPVHDGVFY